MLFSIQKIVDIICNVDQYSVAKINDNTSVLRVSTLYFTHITGLLVIKRGNLFYSFVVFTRCLQFYSLRNHDIS